MTVSVTRIVDSFKYYFTIFLTFLFVFGVPFTFLPVNSSKLVFLFLLGLLFLKFASTHKLNMKIDINNPEYLGSNIEELF
ncbi:MAG TPA: hypothetical protein K8U92_05435 [Aliarcobacter thereius]|nr:hypothetical protein [Aliarcobacter thereius]HJE03304.1 hypothetical protein [Aliarcobacter thereius]